MLITVEFPVIVEGYPARARSKHIIIATHVITVDIKEKNQHQLTFYGAREIIKDGKKFYSNYYLDGNDFYVRRTDTFQSDYLNYDFKFEGKAGHPIQELPQNVVLKRICEVLDRKTKAIKVYPRLIEQHYEAYRASTQNLYQMERSKLPSVLEITLTDEGESALKKQEIAFRESLERLLLVNERLFSLNPEPVLVLEQFTDMPPILQRKDNITDVFDEAFEINPWEVPPKVFTMGEHDNAQLELISMPFEGEVRDRTADQSFSIEDTTSSTIDILGANACILADFVRRRSAATLAGITRTERYPTMSERQIVRHIDEIPLELFHILRELGVGVKQFQDGAGRQTLIHNLDKLTTVGDIEVWIGQDILQRVKDTVGADLDSDVTLSSQLSKTEKPVI
jgi:hypothetical protein